VVDHYIMDTVTETAPGAFGLTDTQDLDTPVGANEALFPDTFIAVDKQGGDFLQAFFNMRFIVKTDDTGALKSAQLKTVGGEAVSESTVNGNAYFGTFSMSGKTIEESKLPFTPPPPPPPPEP